MTIQQLIELGEQANPSNKHGDNWRIDQWQNSEYFGIHVGDETFIIFNPDVREYIAALSPDKLVPLLKAVEKVVEIETTERDHTTGFTWSIRDQMDAMTQLKKVVEGL